jgi:DNA-binding CsgD family transcriptional regulator
VRGPGLKKRCDSGPRKPRGASVPVRDALSPRDLECLELCSQGMRDLKIASRCGITTATVKGYFFWMLKKTETKTRCELVARYVRENENGR